MKDDRIAPVNCLWCGEKIPEGRRGHGHPPKTCSEECRKARAAAREKERYTRVKGTTEWQETRQAYIQKIKTRLASDPEYAAIFRAYANEQNRAHRTRIRGTQAHAETLAAKREERAAWRARLLDEPMAWEAHKFKARRWYHGLGPEDRERIFYAPARRRKAARDHRSDS